MDYIRRDMEKELRNISAQFPLLLLTGPRQTGKSTMLKYTFPRHKYITFDETTLRLAANDDPAEFVKNLETPVIIDEIQYAPNILPYIKMEIDRNRKNGTYVLTGSQVFNVMARVTESLAGRAGLFELLPFSFNELGGKPENINNCFNQIYRGFYPAPNTEKTDTRAFYGAYLSLYVERDVRQIQNIKDISTFEIFLQLLASRAGNLLNAADLAKDCGIAPATCKTWLSILESSRIIYLLRPWFRNTGKRFIKSPKIYFTDTGLLAYLLKYPDARTLQTGKAMGAIFENMIIIEILKRKFNRRLMSDFYFYRDSNGVEVDLVVDSGLSVTLFEIKASNTLYPEMSRSLKLADFQGDVKKYVISLNKNRTPLEKGITAIPWWEI